MFCLQCQTRALGTEAHENSQILVYCWIGDSVEQGVEHKFGQQLGLGFNLSSAFQLWGNPWLTVPLPCSLWHATPKELLSSAASIPALRSGFTHLP